MAAIRCSVANSSKPGSSPETHPAAKLPAQTAPGAQRVRWARLSPDGRVPDGRVIQRVDKPWIGLALDHRNPAKTSHLSVGDPEKVANDQVASERPSCFMTRGRRT